MNGYWSLIQSKFTRQSDWVIVMVIICHWFQLVTISQLLLGKLQRNNFQKNMIPAEGGPKGADWVKDEFKWRFFTNDDFLKVIIQFQKFLKIPKFCLTEGVIFNSENCKLSLA